MAGADDNIIDLASERRRRGPRFNGGLMDILEVSRDLVCLCRGGGITAINGAGVRMLGGRVSEDLLGRQMADFLIPEYGPVMELFFAGMSSEDKPVPTRIVAIDGSLTDVEMQVFRAREIDKDATVVMCRDISHEGRLASHAQERDTRFHLLVDNAMNLVCHTFGGVVRYINRAGVEMLGALEPEAVIGRPLAELFHADYAELFAGGMLESVVAEGVPVPLRLRRLDGEAVDAVVKMVQLSSRGGGELMVEARDITAHNRAVNALRRANETLEIRVIARTRELAAQRARAEEHRQAAEHARRFTENLIDTIPSPVWFKDARGKVQTTNRAFRDLFGCETGRLAQCEQALAAAMPEEDAVSDLELLSGSRTHAEFEASIQVPGQGSGCRRLDGLFLKTAFLDDDGRVVGVIGIMTDITERKGMERELRRLATTDPLTGAFNRRHFMAAANAELERAGRYGGEVSILMLDIDHFKAINDRFGHAAGDAALKALVAGCRDWLRDVDVLGRMGGEEFAILLPETAMEAAREVAERLRQRIAELRVASGADTVAFTSSLGVAGARLGETGVEAVLARADEALYRAKSGGRNRVEIG
ncbi:diguanylate cyclase [Magnetospirillum sp. UT-4]|uniref:sensor domain-containing diguanylate cyclase n=1 Tax=Magnetospirillum sp. UT-4 TaxID=2681467 RepID=UPI00157480C7|nr:diguanylate cyclase [Magnetospirillum sp. UT-4]